MQKINLHIELSIMNENQKLPVTVLFHDLEVQNGQRLPVPRHNIFNALGEEQQEECSSKLGTVLFTGGYPIVRPIINCDNKENQICFKVWK